MARHGAQNAEENCTSVAFGPSGTPSSALVMAGPLTAGSVPPWRRPGSDRRPVSGAQTGLRRQAAGLAAFASTAACRGTTGGTHDTVALTPGQARGQRSAQDYDKHDQAYAHDLLSTGRSCHIPGRWRLGQAGTVTRTRPAAVTWKLWIFVPLSGVETMYHWS